jgi:hypothetical protein
LGSEKKSCCLRAEVRFIFDYTKDRRGVDLISDALPFGRLWYGEPNAASNAVDYAKFRSRSHDAVIHFYAEAGNVIDTHEHAGVFNEWWRRLSSFRWIPLSKGRIIRHNSRRASAFVGFPPGEQAN